MTTIDNTTHNMGDDFTFELHVGCPSAASNDTYTFVDISPNITYLHGGESSSVTFVNVTYQSLTQSLPFTCRVQSSYSDIDISSYVD